jgi:hypothetical protein
MILSDKLAAEFAHEYRLPILTDGVEVSDAVLREIGLFCLAYVNAQLIIIGCQQWSIMQRN